MTLLTEAVVSDGARAFLAAVSVAAEVLKLRAAGKPVRQDDRPIGCSPHGGKQECLRDGA